MIDFIRTQFSAFGFDQTAIRKIELASEEALVNVIEHGYKDPMGKIDIQIATFDHEYHILIQDRAPPFNPLIKDVGFDPLASLEERKIGGLGILFMRQYVDEVRYARQGDRNVLTLIKRTT